MRRLLEIFIILSLYIAGCATPKPLYQDIQDFRVIERGKHKVATCSTLTIVLYEGVTLDDVSEALGCDNGYGSVMYKVLTILDRTTHIVGVYTRFGRGHKVVILKTEYQLDESYKQLMVKYGYLHYQFSNGNTLGFYDYKSNSVFVCLETLDEIILVHEFTHMIQDRLNMNIDIETAERMAHRAEAEYRRFYGTILQKRDNE